MLTIHYTQVCVEACPNTTWSYNMPFANETELREDMICLPTINPIKSNEVANHTHSITRELQG